MAKKKTETLDPSISVKATDAVKKEVFKWVDEQIKVALQDRSDLENRWEKWIKQYEEILPEKKSFPWENACFPPDVEILSETGWKLVKDVFVGEKVLSREPITGRMTWQAVESTHSYPFNGKLIRLSNLFFDISVTPNHRFSLETPSRNGENTKEVTAQEIMDGFAGQTHAKLPLSGIWDAEPSITLWGYDPADFMALLGWYISEGWSYKNRCIGIGQSEKANPGKVAEIKSLLTRMGLCYDFDGTRFLINIDASIVTHLKELGNAYQKFIPAMYLDLPPGQLQPLFDSLVKGDGHHTHHKDKHRNFPSTTYYTTSKRLADDFQILCLKLGYSASIHIREPKDGGKIRGRKITGIAKGYTVSVRYTRQTRTRQDRAVFEYQSYCGNVHCVTVPPWHSIYVRQNGKPLWTLNSNISLPVSAISVETIHSREVNTLLSVHPYVQVRPKKKGVNKDACAKIERFLEQVFVNVVDLYDVGSQWLLEKNKMGTGFLKCYWCYDRKKKNLTDFIDTDDVKAEPVSIEDLIFPSNAIDLQSCSFVAHRIRTHWNALKAKEAMGVYQNVDELKNSEVTSTESADSGKDIQQVKEQRVEKTQRTSPSILKEYEIFEVYFDYDIDNDGYAEPTVMTIHRNHGKNVILRWIVFPYNHGKRPFIRNVYQSRVKRIYGKGICEQAEHLSEAINTAFNQTIDNMTIANVKCFKGRSTAKRDIGSIYPGKVFWLDDVTDLQEFSLGDVHQSNFVLHGLLRDYLERRTKVTDYSLGKESSTMKSRATATGTLALLQESGRHFDLVINNSRKALAELAYQIIELYAQYRPEKVFAVDGPEQIEDIGLPEIGNLREEYNFFCAATSLAVNKEIEKQSNLLLLQQLGAIFSQMIQLLSTVFNPQIQMPDELRKFLYGVIRSYYTMAQDLVRSFEKIDVSSYIPDLPAVIQEAYGQGNQVSDFMNMLGGMINVNNQEGINPTATGLPELGGVDGLPGGSGPAKGGGIV